MRVYGYQVVNADAWPFDPECPECGDGHENLEAHIDRWAGGHNTKAAEAQMQCGGCGHQWRWENEAFANA